MKKTLISAFIIIATLLPNIGFAQTKAESQAYQFFKDRGWLNENFKETEPITLKDFLKYTLKLTGIDLEKDYKKEQNPCPHEFEPQSEYVPYFQKAEKLELIEIKNEKCFPESKINKLEALKHLFFLYGLPLPKVYETENLPLDINKKAAFAPIFAKALKEGLIEKSDTDYIYPFSKLTQIEALSLIFKTHNYANPSEKNIIEEEFEKPEYNLPININMGTLEQLNEIPNSEMLLDVISKLNEKYYFAENENITTENIVYKAINAITKNLEDPFTTFQEPQNQTLQNALSSHFEGIGIRIYKEKEDITILNVLRNSPAAKAGLQAKDIILKVEDQNTLNLKLEEVAEKIRGEKGTTVSITILRPETKETLEFSVIRDSIEVEQIEARMLENQILYIAIDVFGDKTDLEFNEIINEQLKNNPKGIIIDLRNNGGGYFHIVNRMLENFIEKDKPIVHLQDRAKNKLTVNSELKPKLKNYPLVVLVNKASASASEIFASAIQDYKLGTLVGTTTFGKGTVQEIYFYQNGASFKMTFANWLTAKEKNINGTGITPDVEVMLTMQDLEAGLDPQLAKAIEILNK